MSEDTTTTNTDTNAETTDTGQQGASGDSTQTKTWYDGLGFSEEEVGFIQNKSWDSPVKAVQAYREFEKFKGVPDNQLAKIPAKPDDAEGWSKLYEKLGRPADAKGYEFKPDDGMDIDGKRLEWFNETAHKLGLNKSQHNALVKEAFAYESDVLNSHQEAENLRIQAEEKASMDKLKSEWGNQYNERLELGRRAFRSFADGETIDKLEEALGMAAVVKMFSQIGEKLGEDRIRDADSSKQGYGKTPQQAKDDIDRLKTEVFSDRNRLDLYNKKQGPDYQNMQNLLKIAHG